MDDNEKITRGSEAKSLLEHPVLRAAFDEIERDIFEVWRGSSPSDTEARETGHKVLIGLGLVEEKLKNYGAIGDLAKYNQEQEKEEKDG